MGNLADKKIAEEFDKGNVRPYWTQQLQIALVGATITNVRYTTDAEQKMMGWDNKGAVLVLKKKGEPDPYYIFPQMDDEGNDAGALAYGCFNPKVKVKEDLFPVI